MLVAPINQEYEFMMPDQPYFPEKPANEAERLRALRSLRILDTDHDAVLDSLAYFATQLFDVPTALVSLVDSERQWFKAKHGMSESQYPRNWSFCAHMVAKDLSVMVIEDAEQHPILAGNPLVQEFKAVRFYAGCAIRSKEGYVLGSFCLLDTKPRTFSETELTRLKQLAGTVEAMIHNSQENRQLNENLIRQAFYDPLTGLPTRTLLRERIQGYHSFANASTRDVTLAIINPRRFKALNQSLGREKGDELLREIASRLCHVAPVTGMVARLHEDRFALLATSPGGSGSLGFLDRLKKTLATPFGVGDVERDLDFSIGIAEEPLKQIDDPDSLIEKAQLALEQTEQQPGTSVAALSPQQHRELTADLSLESRLRQAIENQELELHYQPIFDMSDQAIVGVEALVRWYSDGAWIPPGQFIPLAEKVGLIQVIGEWILRTACAQFKSAIGDNSDRYLSVNISAHELYADDFVARVEAALTQSGLAPGQLYLELTEHSLIRDVPFAVEQMQKLVARGVHFAIDDFGTGFASLRYLQLLPVDTLKIDRCFVESLPHGRTDIAIVRAIIAMANNLELKITCEGIETAEQMRCLQQEGATVGQGWYFAKAMPIEQFRGRIALR